MKRSHQSGGLLRFVIYVTSLLIVVRHDRSLRDIAKWCETMTSENRELSVEELGSVAGGGLVDNVLPEAEASTAEFLKRFAEASLRFNAFINSPASQGPAATNQG